MRQRKPTQQRRSRNCSWFLHSVSTSLISVYHKILFQAGCTCSTGNTRNSRSWIHAPTKPVAIEVISTAASMECPTYNNPSHSDYISHFDRLSVSICELHCSIHTSLSLHCKTLFQIWAWNILPNVSIFQQEYISRTCQDGHRSVTSMPWNSSRQCEQSV